jgi:hypothetical protein
MKLIPLLFIAIVSSFSRAVVIEDLADLSVCDLFAASATLELDIQTAKTLQPCILPERNSLPSINESQSS